MSANLLSFSEKLRAIPLLPALVTLIVGIVAGTFSPAVPLYIWAVGAVVFAVTAGLATLLPPGPRTEPRPRARAEAALPRLARPSGSRSRIASLYLGLAVLFFGATSARLHSPRVITPQGVRLSLEVRLTDSPVFRGRSGHTSGVVVSTGERLLVSFDTLWGFRPDQVVKFSGYVNPIDSVSTSYSRLMRARGFVGRTYISRFSQPEALPATHRSISSHLRQLRSAASARLLRLAPEDRQFSEASDNQLSDALSVASAMTAGDRSGISPSLRESYARTGASHLLAVSGLHVGIVFLIINALLYLLPFFRGGRFIKNALAVLAIWSYAALSGLSPSATRAAIMFTGAQVALAFSRTHSGANILCGTALVMLSVRPGLLFDISFQFSFVAVAAIMAWFPPLFRLVESRFRLLNALWGVLIVGFVASVATLPLVSHNFGVFSVIGVVLNPLVILTAHFIVGFSLLWILLPLPFLQPVFRCLVVGPAWLQNAVIESVARIPGSAVEWSMPSWMVFAVYVVFITFTACFYARRSYNRGV